MSDWSKELEVAVRASNQAVELALRYQPGIVAETKPDKSPVTAADRECEKLIARILSEAFPEDGLLGEEGVNVASRSGRRWIIDPIDGTRDYLRGNPLWVISSGSRLGTMSWLASSTCPCSAICIPQAAMLERSEPIRRFMFHRDLQWKNPHCASMRLAS